MSTVTASVCSELEALRATEKEVVNSLESADLMKLCGEAVEIGVVPQHVMKSLESMDWDNVPCPRVIRYLLMHVYRSVKENLRLYDRWLELLQKYGFSTHKLKLRSVWDKDTILEEHISQLSMILGPQCARKWDDICTVLNLPESVRHDIHVKQISYGSTSCFTHLLTEWVLGGYEHAKPPTLENLKKTLRSDLVGRGAAAERLQDVTFQGDAKATLPRLPLEIVRRSPDTEVSEGKSTLLEVQAITNLDAGIHYQWRKNGVLLKEGLHSNIVCILEAETLSKGTYQCVVSVDGVPSIPAIKSCPISLEVSMSFIKRTLVDIYLDKPEVPEDSRPPESNNTYINLALIKRGNMDRAGEHARNTVQGNIDDNLADKESIKYENVFTNLESATRLLIEGRPGSGKTTLVHKFSQDWARGNPALNLKNIKLLFLVPLRGLFNAPFEFKNIVQIYYRLTSTVDQVVQEAEEKNGEGICIILDGLDEYQPESMKQTFAYRLIKKEVLTKSVVIIASRPAATYQFRSIKSFKQVEVIGFLKEQIFNYIEKYPFSEDAKQSSLHQYLKHHPNVHQMCYLPIHAAMVCYLFDFTGSTLPRTETEMYKEFTNFTLLHTLTRDDSKAEAHCEMFESAENLPDTEKRLFSEICELSFAKTVSSKQVMKRTEVKGFISNVNSSTESLGLITVDRMSRKYGFVNTYTFLHLTFQEYLAAYHLFKHEKQLQILKEHRLKQHMKVVWKFFCGLARFSKNDVRLRVILSMNEDNLFGVQCAFESQQSVVCDYVVESGEHNTLSFKDHFLTPSDLTAIGYVMKTTTCPVEKLVLDNCTLSHEGIHALFGEGENVLSVKTLCFHGDYYSEEQYELRRFCLKRMPSIEILDLSNTILGKIRIDSLTRGVTLPNLHTLKLSSSTGPSYMTPTSFRQLHFNSPKLEHVFVDNSCFEHTDPFFCNSSFLQLYGMGKQSHVTIKDNLALAEGLKEGQCTSLTTSCSTDDGIIALTVGLQHCCNLKTLLMDVYTTGMYLNLLFSKGLWLCNSLETLHLTSKRNIGDDGARALSEGLRNCNTLQSLDLPNSNIGDDGVKALSECLQHCNSLYALNFGGNNIGDEGTITLAENLQHCNKLQRLDLCSNNIGDDGAKALAESLQHCNILHMLDLHSNNIGDNGTKALAACIQHSKYLSLELHRNRIGDDGAKALAESFQYCNHLSLSLTHNIIGSDGAKALAQYCYRRKLLLDCNNIGDNGAKALAKGLQHCNSLQTLDLPSNNIDDDGAKAIAEGLQHCKDLQALNLSSNHIGDKGAIVLAEHLQHCKSLQLLDLHSNSISNDGAKALAECLQHCNRLELLDLCSNKVSDDGAKALAEGLKSCNDSLSLHLTNNIIGPGGAKALALHCLTLLLGNNKIGVDGAKALAECLQHCKSLDLDRNDIGDDGAIALARGLQHCNSLWSLDLGRNHIGDDGATALARSLPHCNDIHSLALPGNNIGNDGAKALAENLHHCNNLWSLFLQSNNIGDDGAKALAKGLQRCIHLTSLYLSSNDFSNDGAKALAEHLQNCYSLRLDADIKAITESTTCTPPYYSYRHMFRHF